MTKKERKPLLGRKNVFIALGIIFCVWAIISLMLSVVFIVMIDFWLVIVIICFVSAILCLFVGQYYSKKVEMNYQNDMDSQGKQEIIKLINQHQEELKNNVQREEQ